MILALKFFYTSNYSLVCGCEVHNEHLRRLNIHRVLRGDNAIMHVTTTKHYFCLVDKTTGQLTTLCSVTDDNRKWAYIVWTIYYLNK